MKIINKIITIFMIIGCISPVLINLSNEEWNSDDMITLQRAKKRCKELYKNSPCLVKFIKVQPLMYRAICGRER